MLAPSPDSIRSNKQLQNPELSNILFNNQKDDRAEDLKQHRVLLINSSDSQNCWTKIYEDKKPPSIKAH